MTPGICKRKQREIASRRALVHISLDRADFVQRLIDEGAYVGNAILARARSAPDAAADEDDRQDDQRRERDDDQREPEIGNQQHADGARQQ